MRLDPKGTIRGYPTLLVRSTLRCLRDDLVWGEEALEKAAKLTPGTGRPRSSQSSGSRRADRGIAARRLDRYPSRRHFGGCHGGQAVSRHTAERALAQFLERVARVNVDPYFLARVERVALYGSLLRPEVKRLSDVDLAVQLVAKEIDFERLREANAERVEQLAILVLLGHKQNILM
jgi:predicted nucleotidyltransferase